LTAAFVARALGVAPPAGASPAGGSSAAGSRPASANAPASRDDRLVVDHALSHDRRDAAYPIPAVPFTARSDTRNAARDAGDPSDCAANGGTVWYAFAADRDTRLLASTTGSDYATALAVYDEHGRSLGCGIDGSGNAQVPFGADGGSRYLFEIAGPLGGGRLQFNLDIVGSTRMVSRDAAGNPEHAGEPTISEDGRFVAYTGGRIIDLVEKRVITIRDVDGERIRTWNPQFSADARFVAFSSQNKRIVRGDTNNYEDVFRYDRVTGEVQRVSVSSTGAEGTLPLTTEDYAGDDTEGSHQSQAISRDGRHVVFSSALTGLVPDDTDASCTVSAWQQGLPRPGFQPRPAVPVGVPTFRCRDVFVRDVVRGTTVRISESAVGEGANADSGSVDMSEDGRFVAFASDASNLVDGDTNLHRDVFLHDRDADADGVFDESGAVATELISRAVDGAQADGNSAPYAWPRNVSMSADARSIAFVSEAGNIVRNDANGRWDIFVHERLTGTNTLVEIAHGPVPDGVGPSHWDVQIDLSSDGRYLAFDMPAADLAEHTPPADLCAAGSPWARHVHLHDRATRSTVRLTMHPGRAANGGSFGPVMSRDARYVVFHSEATNLDETVEEPCRWNPLEAYWSWIYVYERPTR
jgi:Tol biopolymer transport system component